MTLVTDRTGADNENHSDTSDGGFPGYSETSIFQGFVTPRAMHDGYLFLDVNISGTITDAKITVVDLNFGGGAITTDVFGDDNSGSPGVFSSGDSSADRTATTTSVTWDYDPGSESVEDSPDLAGILDELITSYTTLVNLAIFVINDGAGANHDIFSFSNDSAKSPLLTVNFTAAGGAAGIRNPMGGPVVLRNPLGAF